MINYNEAMAAIKDLNDRPVGPRIQVNFGSREHF